MSAMEKTAGPQFPDAAFGHALGNAPSLVGTGISTGNFWPFPVPVNPGTGIFVSGIGPEQEA